MALFSVGHKRFVCTCPHVWWALAHCVAFSCCSYVLRFPLNSLFFARLFKTAFRCCSRKKNPTRIALFLFWILSLLLRSKPNSILMANETRRINGFAHIRLHATIFWLENQLNLWIISRNSAKNPLFWNWFFNELLDPTAFRLTQCKQFEFNADQCKTLKKCV